MLSQMRKRQKARTLYRRGEKFDRILHSGDFYRGSFGRHKHLYMHGRVTPVSAKGLGKERS